MSKAKTPKVKPTRPNDKKSGTKPKPKPTPTTKLVSDLMAPSLKLFVGARSIQSETVAAAPPQAQPPLPAPSSRPSQPSPSRQSPLPVPSSGPSQQPSNKRNRDRDGSLHSHRLVGNTAYDAGPSTASLPGSNVQPESQPEGVPGPGPDDTRPNVETGNDDQAPVMMVARRATLPQNYQFYTNLMLLNSAFMSTTKNMQLLLMHSNLQHVHEANQVPVPVLLPAKATSRLQPGARLEIATRDCGRWAAAHQDFLLEEMWFMWRDFRCERRKHLENAMKLAGWVKWHRRNRIKRRGNFVAGCRMGDEIEVLVGEGEILKGSRMRVGEEGGWVCERDVQGLGGQWVRVRRWLGYRTEREMLRVVDDRGRLVATKYREVGAREGKAAVLGDQEELDAAEADAEAEATRARILTSRHHTPEAGNRMDLNMLPPRPRASTPAV